MIFLLYSVCTTKSMIQRELKIYKNVNFLYIFKTNKLNIQKTLNKLNKSQINVNDD